MCARFCLNWCDLFKVCVCKLFHDEFTSSDKTGILGFIVLDFVWF